MLPSPLGYCGGPEQLADGGRGTRGLGGTGEGGIDQIIFGNATERAVENGRRAGVFVHTDPFVPGLLSLF